MRVLHTAHSRIIVCSECNRPSEHVIELATFHVFCDRCVTEALALLLHAASVTTYVEPLIVNE